MLPKTRKSRNSGGNTRDKSVNPIIEMSLVLLNAKSKAAMTSNVKIIMSTFRLILKK